MKHVAKFSTFIVLLVIALMFRVGGSNIYIGEILNGLQILVTGCLLIFMILLIREHQKESVE